MKQILIPMLAGLALLGCSKSEMPDTGGAAATKGEIRVTAGIDGAKTRALVDAATGLVGGTSFVVRDGSTEPTSWAGSAEYAGYVAPTTGKVQFFITPKYNLNDQNAYMVAYFPGKTLTNNAVEWKIDGRTDIMVTKNIWNAGKYTAPNTTGLQFNHCLSRIEVFLSAEAGVDINAIRALWGFVTKIEFVGAPTKMKYDLTTTPTITFSDPVNFALFADYIGYTFKTKSIPATPNATPDAVAVLAPVEKTLNESFKLKVTSTGDGVSPVEVEVPVDLNNNLTPMTAGHVHTVVLTFKLEEKKIAVTTSTVKDWITSGAPTGGNEVEIPIVPTLIMNGTELTKPSMKGYFYQTYYSVPFATTKSYDDREPNKAPFYETEEAVLAGEPPYEKFEVAPTDETYSPVVSNYWVGAWNACKNKTTDGGGWRMPRLTEMMLIYLNRYALVSAGGGSFGTNNYWSASQYDNYSDYILAFDSSGYLAWRRSDETRYKVRCVREIP